MSRLRINTCSWRYPSWEGLIYSAADGIDHLSEYAQRYETVEIDRWFWSLFATGDPRLPDPTDVDDYRRCVPPDFRFTVKAPNAITLTHRYAKTKGDPLVANPHFLSADLFARFHSLIEPLGDSVAAIILQFGYLNRQHLRGQNELLDRLSEFLGQIPSLPSCGVEIRNPKWLNESHFDFLHRHGVVPALVHGYWMPPVWETHREHRDLLHQAETVVIRLHGPDREGMERETGKRWDALVVRREEELRYIVAMVEELLAADVEVFLNVNNHYEGCAPLTIERIEAMLGIGNE